MASSLKSAKVTNLKTKRRSAAFGMDPFLRENNQQEAEEGIVKGLFIHRRKSANKGRNSEFCAQKASKSLKFSNALENLF